MTKAYIEGFSKTAEAYGIDPEALKKVAAQIVKPKYETNGWAPSTLIDSTESYDPVPHLFSASTEDNMERKVRFDPRVEQFRPFLTAPGPAGAWWKAHRSASQNARAYQAAMEKATKDAPSTLKNRLAYLFSGKWPQVPANSPEDIARQANTRYHANMMTLTNSPSSSSYFQTNTKKY